MINRTSYSESVTTSRKSISSASFNLAHLALLLGFAFLPGCAKKTACTMLEPAPVACSPDKLFARPKSDKNSLTVTAMAYTAASVGKGRKSLPRAANGEVLTPEVSAIAVSPDLIEQHGLSLDKTVRISGLDGEYGEYKVMDLMSPRHSKSIDIYFGNDNAGARQWGKRTLTLSWD
jgi:3D (Asp-Asp-Asp) domain-containing protein